MKLALLAVIVALAIPLRSWGGSEENESLEPIDVDPRAALTIWYPGDDRPLPWIPGPRVRQAVPVVEGDRVPITRSPDGSCPRVRLELETHAEELEQLFEEDGRHLWYPGSSAETSEHVDGERCEAVVDEARAQVIWERVEIRPLTAAARARFEEMGLKIPIGPSDESP